MRIERVRLVYFSPTGTTRTVLENIARGLEIGLPEHMDLTLPASERQAPAEIHGELVLIGAPVYAGRIPDLAARRLRRLEGRDSPAVVVAVYGNRAYEDALLELRDIALQAGFRPLAAGAFIGEHSFSTAQAPIAPGRPDNSDVHSALHFGQAIREKIDALAAPGEMPPLRVPGNTPYRGRGDLAVVPPISQRDLCTQCQACVAVCPAAAIAFDGVPTTDPALCIMCCACVKACPSGARIMQDPQVKRIVAWLRTDHSERREPETHL